MKFKLTDLELQILTNFNNINYNFMFRKNEKCLKTISTMRNIFAEFDTKRIITNKDIGIYKLDEFLNAHDRFNSSELEFKSYKVKDTYKNWNEDRTSYKTFTETNTIEYILFKDEEDELKYHTTDPSAIVRPPDNFIPPDELFTFELQAKEIKKLLKFSNLLKLVDFKIYTDKGYVWLHTLDKKSPKNNPSNSYKFRTTKQTNMNFCFYCKIENMKMLIGDYKVTLCKAKVFKLEHLTQPLSYWIAFEPDSNFEDLDTTNEKGKVLEPKPRKSSK